MSLIASVPAACTNIVFLWNVRSSCRIIPRWWHVINAAAHLDMDTCVCHHKITNANCFCDLIRKVITCSVSRFVDVRMKRRCTTAGPRPQHYFKQKKKHNTDSNEWVALFPPLFFLVFFTSALIISGAKGGVRLHPTVVMEVINTHLCIIWGNQRRSGEITHVHGLFRPFKTFPHDLSSSLYCHHTVN